MTVDGRNHPLHAQAELFCSRLNDPYVRLMRYQPVELRFCESCRRKCFVGHFTKHFHREFEYRIAFHLQQWPPAYFATRDAARHRQNVGIASICMQARSEYSRMFASREDHRARAVAEKHARSAILPVEDAGVHFGANNQCVTILPGFHQVVGGRQRVDEAAANRLHVESGAVRDAELCLEQARGARKNHVRGRRRDDDEIDVLRRDAGGLDRLAARRQRQIARVFAVSCDVALPYAGATVNPLV